MSRSCGGFEKGEVFRFEVHGANETWDATLVLK